MELKSKSKLLYWIQGFALIIDGTCIILTLGNYSPSLTTKIIMYKYKPNTRTSSPKKKEI